MDATQLKAYRDKLYAAEKNIALRLYCDNGIIIDEGTMFVKWDDASNIVIAIKSNDDQVNHPGVKIKTIITDYDMVQYVMAYSTRKSIKPLATALGYSSTQIDNLIDKFDNVDIRSYINTTPKEVIDVIAAEDTAKEVEYKKNIELQEKFAEEHRIATATQIRKRFNK